MQIRILNGPPTGDDLPHLLLLRLPAAGVLKLAATTADILHLETHFVGHRTLPCLTDDCPGCAEDKPKRYEGYIGGWTTKPNRHVILALTAGAARSIIAATTPGASLRGRVITFSRNGSRPNGMVKAEILDECLAQEKLPGEPDLLAHLIKIWGLDTNHIATDHPDYAATLRNKATPNGQKTHASIPPH